MYFIFNATRAKESPTCPDPRSRPSSRPMPCVRVRRSQPPPPRPSKDEIFAQRLLRPPRPRAGRYEMVRALAHRRPPIARTGQRASACPGPPTTKLQCRVRARGQSVAFCQRSAGAGWATKLRAEVVEAVGGRARQRRTPPWIVRLARGTREAAIRRRDSTRGPSNAARSNKNRCVSDARSRCWPRAFSDRRYEALRTQR